MKKRTKLTAKRHTKADCRSENASMLFTRAAYYADRLRQIAEIIEDESEVLGGIQKTSVLNRIYHLAKGTTK